EPPAPSKLSEKVFIPPAVDAIILKMVEKDKNKRFADANALREEIARTTRALDSSPDRLEITHVLARIGGVIAVAAARLYFLRRARTMALVGRADTAPGACSKRMDGKSIEARPRQRPLDRPSVLGVPASQGRGRPAAGGPHVPGGSGQKRRAGAHLPYDLEE